MDARIIGSWVAFGGTMIVAALTLWNNYNIREDSKKEQKRLRLVETKLKHQQKLSEFYIPLRHYLENSKTLFKIFMKDKPERFRTLTYLLNPSQKYGDENINVLLNENDKSILAKVFEIGEKIEDLIYNKSYLIGDDNEFVKAYSPREKYKDLPYEKDMTILSLLISHIVVIRLAYDGKLIGSTAKFEGFVFPNEINIRVDEAIKKLNTKIGECEALIQNTMM
ncbi:hypothetical protein [Formosa algae]|uniref:hypothetical protein n=1 Tax=Formosa algae TaxID=225843 RepID=UPI000CCE9797|nr:hypothetical protein [Formosa algae]PNW27809.1 hypothetical protein BKP44_11555 [Formosa algae]